MNLYILRHASAGTRRQNPLLDIKRPLDKEGKQHCLRLAHLLNAQRISFDLIVSSPLKRSLQTAQLIATETGHDARIRFSHALAPEATFKEFRGLLKELGARENVLVVGHSPNIQGFLGCLLIDSRDALDAREGEPGSAMVPQIRLRKGTLARVALGAAAGDPAAMLTGLLDPRTVRALYATSTKSALRKTSRK